MAENKQSLAVIFDFGGVLIDWSPYYLYRKILNNDEEIKAFLEEIDFKNWNPQFDKGYSFTQGVEELSAKFPHRAELIHLFNERWMDAMGAPVTGTIEILRQIKAAGYPIYGLSNWSVEKFNLVKDQFEFLNWLDDYVISGQVQQIKPEPEIYHTLLKRINRSAEECVFIDDSLENISTANSLGFVTIHFQSPAQLTFDLEQMGVLLEN
ncbi:MAG: HAD family hydrolase [Anaerolinea sp.]|nr:HAD family hydrolase [Anaerolinea sp.]